MASYTVASIAYRSGFLIGRLPGYAGNQGVFVREAAAGVLVLAEHQFPIHPHVKHAAATRDQGGFDCKRLLESGSQTDRLRPVVSGAAVGNRDFHACFLSYVHVYT